MNPAAALQQLRCSELREVLTEVCPFRERDRETSMSSSSSSSSSMETRRIHKWIRDHNLNEIEMALTANLRSILDLREFSFDDFERLSEQCDVKSFEMKRRLASAIQSAKRISTSSPSSSRTVSASEEEDDDEAPETDMMKLFPKEQRRDFNKTPKLRLVLSKQTGKRKTEGFRKETVSPPRRKLTDESSSPSRRKHTDESSSFMEPIARALQQQQNNQNNKQSDSKMIKRVKRVSSKLKSSHSNDIKKMFMRQPVTLRDMLWSPEPCLNHKLLRNLRTTQQMDIQDNNNPVALTELYQSEWDGCHVRVKGNALYEGITGKIIEVRKGGWCHVLSTPRFGEEQRKIHVRAAHLIVTKAPVNARFKNRSRREYLKKKRKLDLNVTSIKTKKNKRQQVKIVFAPTTLFGSKNIKDDEEENDEVTEENKGRRSIGREPSEDIIFDFVSKTILTPNGIVAEVYEFYPGAFDSNLKPVWKVQLTRRKSSRQLRKCAVRMVDLSMFEILIGYVRYMQSQVSSPTTLSPPSLSSPPAVMTTTTMSTSKTTKTQKINTENTLKRCARELKELYKSKLTKAIESQNNDDKNNEVIQELLQVSTGLYNISIEIHRRNCNSCKQKRRDKCAFAPSITTAREFCACGIAMDEVHMIPNSDVWIRCDRAQRCNGWIHPKCFGLERSEIPDQMFVCPMCSCHPERSRPKRAFDIFREEKLTNTEGQKWTEISKEKRLEYVKAEETYRLKWNEEIKACRERVVKMIFRARKRRLMIVDGVIDVSWSRVLSLTDEMWNNLTRSELLYFYRLAELCEMSSLRDSSVDHVLMMSGDRNKEKGVEFRKRRKECGVCRPCLIPADCARCTNCLDKPKFGGPGTKKQKCKLRMCIQLSKGKKPNLTSLFRGCNSNKRSWLESDDIYGFLGRRVKYENAKGKIVERVLKSWSNGNEESPVPLWRVELTQREAEAGLSPRTLYLREVVHSITESAKSRS